MFSLDPAFEATSAPIGALVLCEARLQLDARFAWIVLVPRVEDAREIEHLRSNDQTVLMAEIVLAGRAVRAIGEALGRPVEKLNVGLLGNVTTQLHAHVVGRRADDPAWPGPVWGFGDAGPCSARDRAMAIGAALRALGVSSGPV